LGQAPSQPCSSRVRGVLGRRIDDALHSQVGLVCFLGDSKSGATSRRFGTGYEHARQRVGERPSGDQPNPKTGAAGLTA
jgi:hypothetical protein